MLWQIKSRLRGYKVFVQQPPNGKHLQTIALQIFLIDRNKKENGKLFGSCYCAPTRIKLKAQKHVSCRLYQTLDVLRHSSYLTYGAGLVRVSLKTSPAPRVLSTCINLYLNILKIKNGL